MDKWTNRLSDYIDDELNESERAELEGHIAQCEDCRVTLAELRSVADLAGSLPDRSPENDLWAGISQRIDSGRITPLRDSEVARRRMVRFSIPQLAAAAAVLMLVSSAVGVAISRSAPPPVAELPAADGRSGVYLAGQTETQYEAAITELEAALEQGREVLDPETVAVLEENLRTIDAAILEARRALATDPGNAYLNGYLARTMRTKLSILERGNIMVVSASL